MDLGHSVFSQTLDLSVAESSRILVFDPEQSIGRLLSVHFRNINATSARELKLEQFSLHPRLVNLMVIAVYSDADFEKAWNYLNDFKCFARTQVLFVHMHKRVIDAPPRAVYRTHIPMQNVSQMLDIIRKMLLKVDTLLLNPRDSVAAFKVEARELDEARIKRLERMTAEEGTLHLGTKRTDNRVFQYLSGLESSATPSWCNELNASHWFKSVDEVVDIASRLNLKLYWIIHNA